MDRITADQFLKSKLEVFVEPVEVVDEAGHRLGHFVPASEFSVDDCPYSADELRRMRAESGGRALAEIWKSLGAK